MVSGEQKARISRESTFLKDEDCRVLVSDNSMSHYQAFWIELSWQALIIEIMMVWCSLMKLKLDFLICLIKHMIIIWFRMSYKRTDQCLIWSVTNSLPLRVWFSVKIKRTPTYPSVCLSSSLTGLSHLINWTCCLTLRYQG